MAKKVLVVDDDFIDAKTHDVLRSAVGVEIELEFYPLQADQPFDQQLGGVANLLEAEEAEYTALLTDAMFPDQNGKLQPMGIKLADELAGRSVPVVVMSDKADTDRVTMEQTSGRLKFISKNDLNSLNALLEEFAKTQSPDYKLRRPSERLTKVLSNYDKRSRITNGLFPLDEVVKPPALRKVLDEKQAPKSFWGIAPTGPLHLGHDRFFLKQMDLLQCGCDHTVLIADMHVQMNSPDVDPSVLSLRSAYYREAMIGIFGLMSANFVLGSSFQLDREYVTRMLRCLSEVPAIRAYKATPGSLEAGKVSSHLVSWKSEGNGKAPVYTEFPSDFSERNVANLAYPVLQALDVYYLESDIVLADFGQKQIYVNLGNDKKLNKVFAQGRSHQPVLLWKRPKNC